MVSYVHFHSVTVEYILKRVIIMKSSPLMHTVGILEVRVINCVHKHGFVCFKESKVKSILEINVMI